MVNGKNQFSNSNMKISIGKNIGNIVAVFFIAIDF
jgi:hypothetical protein